MRRRVSSPMSSFWAMVSAGVGWVAIYGTSDKEPILAGPPLHRRSFCAMPCTGRCGATMAVLAAALWGQKQESQSASTFSLENQVGQTIRITNAAYEVVGSGIPGLPRDQRLVLRKTTQSKQVVDEIGI